MALKRFVNGAAGEPFFQKRAPGQPARLDPDRRADVPVGPDRRRDRRRRRGRARLGRQPRLHRPQPAPGPRRGPRPPRRAARRPRPGAGRRRGRRSATSRWSPARCSRPSGSSAGRRRPARAASTSTSGSSRAGRSPRSAARRSRSPATSSGGRPTIATSKWWKEERHGVFLDYNQNAKDRTVASAYSVRPLPDARVSMPLALGRGADGRGRGLHARDGARRASPSVGDAGRRHRRGGRVARGAARAVARATRPRAWATRRGRRTTRKQAGEPPRVQPSQPRRPKPSTSRAAATRAARRRTSPRSGRPRSRRATERGPADRVGRLPADADRPAQVVDPGHRDRPGRARRTRRSPASSAGRRAIPRPRRTSSRPTSSSTAMRGRSSLWYRVRVNLIHVPEADRPAQEPLDPDYDPWAGYEWPRRGPSSSRSAATAEREAEPDRAERLPAPKICASS